jgi:hypothetical protein
LIQSEVSKVDLVFSLNPPGVGTFSSSCELLFWLPSTRWSSFRPCPLSSPPHHVQAAAIRMEGGAGGRCRFLGPRICPRCGPAHGSCLLKVLGSWSGALPAPPEICVYLQTYRPVSAGLCLVPRHQTLGTPGRSLWHGVLTWAGGPGCEL